VRPHATGRRIVDLIGQSFQLFAMGERRSLGP
jgi:hypothetical protein